MKHKIFLILTLFSFNHLKAQTDIDGLMMGKKLFCVGGTYTHSSFEDYWEGKLKRNNLNMGTITRNMASLMGNYGVTKHTNLLFNVNYVTTKADAGTMHGMKGLQDLSLMVKHRFIDKRTTGYRLAVFGIAGASAPLTNYVADYLPLSIGMKSKTAMSRLMLDYHYSKKWFATASATYMLRSNITIDRDSYYTDKMILSNEVAMPDMAGYNLRAGYRTESLIVEAILNRMVTLGGFDITRNNMPFPSNRMNATSIGSHIKYLFGKGKAYSFDGEISHVVAGRNVGQSLAVAGSFFYIFNFNKKQDKQIITQ